LRRQSARRQQQYLAITPWLIQQGWGDKAGLPRARRRNQNGVA
jgi:hypothetical protein